jgi:hypothetical protein
MAVAKLGDPLSGDIEPGACERNRHREARAAKANYGNVSSMRHGNKSRCLFVA